MDGLTDNNSYWRKWGNNPYGWLQSISDRGKSKWESRRQDHLCFLSNSKKANIAGVKRGAGAKGERREKESAVRQRPGLFRQPDATSGVQRFGVARCRERRPFLHRCDRSPVWLSQIPDGRRGGEKGCWERKTPKDSPTLKKWKKIIKYLKIIKYVRQRAGGEGGSSAISLLDLMIKLNAFMNY